MRTFARGMMARKETVVELSASAIKNWSGLRTDEYKGIFLRFGEVECPLGTNKVWRANQLC